MNGVIILDFGSQYTQLIARRIREQGVYAEVVPYNININEIKLKKPQAIIFSGGPASVYLHNAPKLNHEVFLLKIPILGICYGLQLIADNFGGEVAKATKQEFGKARLVIDDINNLLFSDIDNNRLVWMSHADHLLSLPIGFKQIGHSSNSIAAIANVEQQIYGVQFHPEVTHSEIGIQMINNFIFKIAHCQKNWNMKTFIENAISQIKTTVKEKKVILGLSGGVDSAVTALLINKAISNQLTCLFIDTGLLRKNEATEILSLFQNKFNLKIKIINAQDSFFHSLQGITDPEQKRKIIGKEFIKAFVKGAKSIEEVTFLAQGTIYSDVIESQSIAGLSKTIKSHHNVGAIPDNLPFQLLEPIRELFKDEVRQVGRQLGLPEQIISRHPFPGPGLGIRVINEITPEKVKILQEVDQIFLEELDKNKYYNKVSQAFATLLPVKTVGVMGDERTYKYLVGLRSVNSIDFMTADVSNLPIEFLQDVANRIINEVDQVNRVVYDITTKPPSTIEWE